MWRRFLQHSGNVGAKVAFAIEGEELDPIVASLPSANSSVTEAVADYLRGEYGLEVDDLVSAELALVPAMQPRDVGFDRALMAIYGQDDKLSCKS